MEDGVLMPRCEPIIPCTHRRRDGEIGHQMTNTLVAHVIASAVSCGFVNFAPLPAKSASTTPRAVAQAFQMKMGIW